MDREQEKIGQEGGGPAADAGVSGEDEAGDGGLAGEGGDGVPGSGSAGIEDLGPDEALAAATIEGCNDQDRVARQLCEAATQERDPFLRAALWDEYNEYKRIIARD
jgi:hypothetical protein